ncbi:hypothetical protein M501DRAFT_417604 [Patellaria atrata CBS 101060]|uniref:Zinc finger PHD-type domain-containing protein n=1 Tax=Patellaria atrata CBS 101060 TaxID=1346257 RepID=A0A9P4SHG1_9PEZI|nr:hypothetical protein M501DRAFT_417604 [Patellaria atrata CBS 101060]
MPSRKRGRQEMEANEPESQPNSDPTLLDKLRNMWEFASLNQYLHMFGSVVKVSDDLDIEEMESECLKPTHSERLSQVGLALLKYVSSHKGLTPEIFDEYTRRQYVAKAPERNPFGTDESPKKFADFDTLTKIRILHQLSTWTLNNADRIRSQMLEDDETQWPLGWDSDNNEYFVLDDNRLYRRTPAPLPPTPKGKPKSKSKPKKKGSRASKRRKVSNAVMESDDGEEAEDKEDSTVIEQPEDDGFGGMKWEWIAITLDEYNAFVDSIKRSRDPNEKVLHKRLVESVLPIIEKRADEQRLKALRKQKELENLQKLATAKRSSRIQHKMEEQKKEQERIDAERKRRADLEMARKEQNKQRKMEEARESRMMTREQRVKEREAKRILHEEELRKLEEDSKKVDSNEARLSERHIKAEMEKRQKELERLADEEEEWIFDCSGCGMHGENLDDGSHSIACEKCNVWQHSVCHGIKQEEAEREDFHFVCNDCRRRAEDTNKPKIAPLKLRIGSSASPKIEKGTIDITMDDAHLTPKPGSSTLDRVEIPPPQDSNIGLAGNSTLLTNGPSLSPQGQPKGPPGIHRTGGAYNVSEVPTFNQPHPISPRPTSSDAIPSSSPAPVKQSALYTNGLSSSRPSFTNGTLPSTTNGVRPMASNPFSFNGPASDSFSSARPPSAHSARSGSPAKLPPPQSPLHRNGIYATPSQNPYPPAGSPYASFPLSTSRLSSHSPVKHSSPNAHRTSPILHHASSPRVLHNSHQQPQGASELLPSAASGISPEKHSSPRPQSLDAVSSTPVLPPVQNLSPTASFTSLEPPVKKTPVLSPEQGRKLNGV